MGGIWHLVAGLTLDRGRLSLPPTLLLPFLLLIYSPCFYSKLFALKTHFPYEMQQAMGFAGDMQKLRAET